jgi:carbamoyltransferase
MLSPYTGKVYNQDEIELDLRRFLSETNSEESLDIQYYTSKEDQIKSLAFKISENVVVGFFQGGSELGPRALGNRSILASPKKEWIKDYINHEIKMREWYRPFAPSVLYENQSEVFDLDVFSPYMLVTARVKEEWKKMIPSVVHIDGTSRYQSVISEFNPDYYSLIKNFYDLTGIPLVLNTSFNGPDEPIVETPYEALRTFWRRNLKSLYIGNYIISRR